MWSVATFLRLTNLNVWTRAILFPGKIAKMNAAQTVHLAIKATRFFNHEDFLSISPHHVFEHVNSRHIIAPVYKRKMEERQRKVCKEAMRRGMIRQKMEEAREARS